MWASLMTWLSNDGGTGFIGFLKSLLSAVISIFVNTNTTGSTTTYEITQFGEIFFGVVVISFVLWALGWVTSLLRLRKN